ncbi:hypothetical protein HJG53_13665 [Sphingomonas sp. ID1715]|uniref:hypothetical protein n=1 Tax=Sphingomonas sp. ID1715 TaxID=1656898 RepID=UPI0014879005|nr:hypothetical protein [Sphingomonas sp. ID1715]NNM77950.1 hypothetical protein [Sphingomonas sp. ID1715]
MIAAEVPPIPPCPIAVEVYASSNSADKARSLVNVPGYRIVSERSETDNVTAIRLEVSNTPVENDEFSAFLGSGALGRIRALNEAGLSLGPPMASTGTNCRSSTMFKSQQALLGGRSAQVYELDQAGAVRFEQIASKLSIKVTLYRSATHILAEVPASAEQTSLLFRLKRGDFGKLGRMGVLADISEAQALQQSQPE